MTTSVSSVSMGNVLIPLPKSVLGVTALVISCLCQSRHQEIDQEIKSCRKKVYSSRGDGYTLSYGEHRAKVPTNRGRRAVSMRQR